VTKILMQLTCMILFFSELPAAMAEEQTIKLYALDCGTISVDDLGSAYPDSGFDGITHTWANPCFLIRHPKGDLLWDIGVPPAVYDQPEGSVDGIFHSKLKVKLTDQLAELGLLPSDIDNLSISHSHYDHLGHANLFARSTFIINKAEHTLMFSDQAKADKSVFDLYAELENAKTKIFVDEYDVFGDGSILVKFMPGHTVGHSVLLIRLANSGSVLLTGDLYDSTEARERRLAPSWTTDIKATYRSMDAFEALAKKETARVVIQHEMDDFDSLPPFPSFLD